MFHIEGVKEVSELFELSRYLREFLCLHSQCVKFLASSSSRVHQVGYTSTQDFAWGVHETVKHLSYMVVRMEPDYAREVGCK